MKRSMALIAAGGFTTIVALISSVSMLSALTPSTQPVQANNPPSIESGVNNQFNTFQAEPTGTVTTAQSIYQQVEKALQEQDTILMAEVELRQQMIAELDGITQVQIAQLDAQTVELQAQIDQKMAAIQAAQETITAFQQAIKNDDATYQNELAKMTNAESQLKQALETASGQLDIAYQELTRRQVQAQQVAIQAAEAQGSSGGGSSNSDHDDHNDHKDHDDDDRDDNDHDDD